MKTGVDRPKTFEEAKRFFSKHQLPEMILHAGKPEAWRYRARLALRGSSSQPSIGLYKAGTHEVVDIPSCKIHHPQINCAVEVIRCWIIRENLSLYNEKCGTGLLRYLQLTVDQATETIQLVLVVNCKEAVDDSILERLQSASPHLWHSIWLNFNTRRDNLIFGKNWQLHHGQQWSHSSALGKTFCTHPESFLQANPEMFGKLLESLNKKIPKNSSILEFYAGVGAIGLSLLKECHKVLCVELVPIAKICFEASQAFLSEAERARISFLIGSAVSHKVLLSEAWDVVIVDPPRKGLDAELMHSLCEADALKQLVYISCGWESFKRDCAMLLKSGWKLLSAELFLFFPGSEHLEVLAIFEKKF